MSILMGRIRKWVIVKLGGVDRAICADFAKEYLTDGRVVVPGKLVGSDISTGLAIVQDRTYIHACILRDRIDGRPIIAMAPWAKHLVIDGCSVVTDAPILGVTHGTEEVG